MTHDSFLVALAVYALVVLSPGPAFVFMTKIGLQEKKAVAFCSLLGYVCGATTNAALAMFAIGTLVEQHAAVGLSVSLFGGFFLVCLALDSLKKARDRQRTRQKFKLTREGKNSSECDRGDKNEDKKKARSRSRLVGFQSGLLVSLSNPKALAFFVAVFAPLVAGLPILHKGFLLVFGFCVKFLWYGSVVFVFKQARIQGFYQRHTVLYDLLLGMVFAGMGFFVLWEAWRYWVLLS